MQSRGLILRRMRLFICVCASACVSMWGIPSKHLIPCIQLHSRYSKLLKLFLILSWQMAPVLCPPLLSLLFGISSSITLYLLMISWKPVSGEAAVNLRYLSHVLILSSPFKYMYYILIISLTMSGPFFINTLHITPKSHGVTNLE